MRTFKQLGFKVITTDDFAITKEEVEQALIDEAEFQNGARPFATYNPLTLICILCKEEHQDIYGHRCKVVWTVGPE